MADGSCEKTARLPSGCVEVLDDVRGDPREASVSAEDDFERADRSRARRVRLAGDPR
jgi:hypothetical protein